jgi:DNA-binding MarR family transcriptional regulator
MRAVSSVNRSSRRLASPARPMLRAWLAVVRAYNLCDLVLAERLADINIRVAEHEILANLLAEPGQSQQRLAAHCFTAKSHISTQLSTLEARGWVRRETDPSDARARQLFLTRTGTAMAKRTVAIQTDVVNQMASALQASELAPIESAMHRVSTALQEMRR